MEINKTVLTELQAIKRYTLIGSREVLTQPDAALYLGISQSTLYKWMCEHKIPYYKNAKLCFFNKKELDRWAMQNRIATVEELNKKATEYVEREEAQR